MPTWRIPLMLQKLNERIQGLVAWIVIVLIAITFTLFGIDYYMQSHQTSNSEVDVNGLSISKQSFELNYRRARQQKDSRKMTAASEKNLKKQVLDEMVLNEVMMQAAKANGFEVSPDQANTAILTIPQFQEDGHFSSSRYQQALNGAMFTPESFQKEVRQGMLLNQQRFAFMGSAFALPSEIERFVKLYMQTRNYDYLLIPSNQFIKETSVSEKAIEDYYQAHPDAFIAPEKVSIDYVRLSMQQIRNKVKISNDAIKQYYQENKNNFLTPAKWQVAHILISIPKDASTTVENELFQKAQTLSQKLKQNPAQFDEMVQTQSDDKLSLSNQGVLPWLVAGQTEFDKSLINLTQAGQISDPIKTSHGFEILKLIDYKPASVKSLEEVQSQIRDQLAGDVSQTNYTKALEELSDLSYQTPDSLEPVAKQLQLTIEHSEPFSRDGGNDPLTKNKDVLNAAYSHDVLELGDNSAPVQLDNDSVIVLRLNKHIKSSKKALSLVHDSIQNQLAKEMAQQEAQKVGQTLVSLKDKDAENKLLKQHQWEWQPIQQATRDTDKVSSSINDLAFSIATPNKQIGKSLPNGDYVVIRLLKVNEGELDQLDKEQKDSIAQQIESNFGVMDYDLYVNLLMKQAKITRN